MFSVKLKQVKFKMITSLLILNTTVDSKTIILFYSGSTKLLWLKTKYVQYFERSILSWQFAPPTIEGQEHRFGDTHVPPLAHGGLHIAGRKGFGFKYYHNTCSCSCQREDGIVDTENSLILTGVAVKAGPTRTAIRWYFVKCYTPVSVCIAVEYMFLFINF